MAGYVSSNGNDFFVARFTTTGALDTSFSSDGIAFDDFGGSGSDDKAYGIAIQSDGKIVVVGSSAGNFAVARVMGGPVLEERLFAMHDANYNVTGIVDASNGSVAERYVYTPYGTRTVIDAERMD